MAPPIVAYPEPDCSGYRRKWHWDRSHALPTTPENKEKVIVIRVLSTPERHYCVTRHELLAVVKAVKHFHVYLYGRKFLLRTDHAALRWLLSFRQPEGQVARWIEALQQYNFTIEHRPGSKHGNADALSRRPCLLDACRYCDRLESVEHSNNATESSVNSTVYKDHCTQVSTISLGQESQSHEDIRKAQLSDEDIKPVIELMEQNGEKPSWKVMAPLSQTTKVYCAQWQSLKMSNGVLYSVWETPSGDSTVTRIVLPKSLRQGVLQQLHNTRTSGHLGIAKTLGRERERFSGCNADKMCKNGAEAVIFVPKSEVHSRRSEHP